MRPGAVGRVVVPVLVLLALTACTSTSTRTRDAREQSPATSASPSPVPVPPARRASSVVRPQRPVALVLPSGVVVPVRAASTTRTGLLDVPADPGIAGWWTGGSRVGDPFGSTLVAAHVDSRLQGLGPFAELLELAGGERLRLVPHGPLTERSGHFAPSGPRRLTLVTCAPPYVASRGGYQNLAVVTAVPVSAPTSVVAR